MISTLQLQYFRALAHRQNLTKCAEDFFVSQSTLSNALSRMEEDLGVQLFDRKGRTLVLNEYGKIYLRYVETALKALEDGQKAIHDRASDKELVVIVNTLNPLVFSKILYKFTEENPDYNLIQREFFINDAKDPDKFDGRVELIIAATEDITSPEWNHYEFREDPLYALLNKDHPAASGESVSFQELKEIPFILEEPRSSFRHFTEKIFAEKHFAPRIAGESNYALLPGTLRRHPEAVALTSMLTKVNGCYMKKDYFVQIPITDLDYTRNYSIFWRKDCQLSEAAQALKEFIINRCGV